MATTLLVCIAVPLLIIMPPHREEDVEPEVESKSRRRRQKKRVKVFEESGLDDEQRRLTRRQQRSLGALIDQSATTDSLQQVRDENNRLFESGVRFTREAVLDADNVEAIVKKNVQQAESMLQVSDNMCFLSSPGAHLTHSSF